MRARGGPAVNRCPASIDTGVLTLHDGTAVDLLKVQATLNYAFQLTGEMEFMEAADQVSLLTGVWQGPHGDFIPNEVPR